MTFKRGELQVVKRQGMRTDVCNCLFTILLIGVRLPDILVPYLQHSEVCKMVPVNTGLCAKSTSKALRYKCTGNWVQKSHACAFEEFGSGEINPCDLAVLGEIWLESGAEVLQRAVQTGTGSAPACLSLGPSVDKTPLVKECWEWCKKRVYNMRGSRTCGQITINRIMPHCCRFSDIIRYVSPSEREDLSKAKLIYKKQFFKSQNTTIYWMFTQLIKKYFGLNKHANCPELLPYLNLDTKAHVSQLAGEIISRPWNNFFSHTRGGSITHAQVNRWQKLSNVLCTINRLGSCEVVRHDEKESSASFLRHVIRPAYTVLLYSCRLRSMTGALRFEWNGSLQQTRSGNKQVREGKCIFFFRLG